MGRAVTPPLPSPPLPPRTRNKFGGGVKNIGGILVAGDPEVHICDFSLGVRVVPGARLPRLPALYPAKKRWRLSEQKRPEKLFGASKYSQYVEDKLCFIGCFLRQCFGGVEDQTTRGQVIKMTEQEARQRYSDLVVASLGAQRKDKPGELCHPGTFRWDSRDHSEHQDQNSRPGEGPNRRRPEEDHAREEPCRCAYFCFNSRCLRSTQTNSRRRTGISSGGQVVPGGSVFINTVGTFGVASASHYWSRVASAIGRVAQYLAGNTAYTWHMWLLTTTILTRTAQTTEQHCFTSSPSARHRTFLCHGARQQGVMWSRGWGLNCFTELECSESRKDGRLVDEVGRVKWQQHPW